MGGLGAKGPVFFTLPSLPGRGDWGATVSSRARHFVVVRKEGSRPPKGGSETKCYQWVCGAPAPFNPRTRLAGDLRSYGTVGGTTPPIPYHIYILG